ncbi:hypothetical protein VNO78_17867 [Psophocarpus tetragonolobus]|uniref:Senescence regulator n=1 Tax=Psophocarpus tetragonolobus TaxID=3891 RepID=A0AAN9SJJ4_PSOTE
MEQAQSFHRRSSSSSDRLLGPFPFSSPSPAPAASSAAEELNEAELFWASESEPQRPEPRLRNFDRPLDSGILVVLKEPDSHAGLFQGKSPVPTSSRITIPSLPRPPASDYLPQSASASASAPSRKFQQSAPMKVPILLSAAASRRTNVHDFSRVLDDNDDDDEMLPPHEIVLRGSGVSPKTTFSVLEGVGRTLKGRDLRQVRNAVLRQTGFLD